MRLEETSLIYLAPGDVLKGRVEPTIWMRMCHHFAEMGLNVELITLYAYRRENIGRSQIFEHYGITDPHFKLTILPTPMTPSPPVWWSQSWTIGLNLLKGLLMLGNKQPKRLVFYSRSPAAIYPYWWLRQWFRGEKRPLFFLETHAMLSRPANAVLKQADGIIVSSHQLAHDITAKLDIPDERLQVAYLAANALPAQVGQQEARQQLGIDPTTPYIIYTGKLLMPEVQMVLETAEIVANTNPDALFLLVGGNPNILTVCQAELTKRNLHNVRFVGFVAPVHIALYQKAASILFVYLDGKRNIIQYITPSKLFDYLQAGRPIIASDYPILHEILHHEQNALLIEPESPVALATAIQRVLQDKPLAARLSQQAQEDAKQYSWQKRTHLIWDFIQRIDTLAGN